jgi:hypothetical protein
MENMRILSPDIWTVLWSKSVGYNSQILLYLFHGEYGMNVNICRESSVEISCNKMKDWTPWLKPYTSYHTSNNSCTENIIVNLVYCRYYTTLSLIMRSVHCELHFSLVRPNSSTCLISISQPLWIKTDFQVLPSEKTTYLTLRRKFLE